MGCVMEPSSQTFIGLDGIPGAWVAVYLAGRSQYFDYGSLDRLLAISYQRAMIDVPIGLPRRGYRACDRQARALVGPCVFLGTRWNVWTFNTCEQANETYWQNDDEGISRQLWCIRDKLKEINELITPQLQLRLKETHPELVFWRLNGEKSLAKKKSSEGRKQRISLLRRRGIEKIDQWLEHRHGTGIGRDDLIDACACALAARDSQTRLPPRPPTERGIHMEIWY
jgi:predicted RNase H-like nuclease